MSLEVWAYIDTGFQGALLVPEAMMAQLGQPEFALPYRLADDSERWIAGYEGRLEIAGLPPAMTVPALAMGSATLVGRSVTDLFTVTLERGRRVVAY